MKFKTLSLLFAIAAINGIHAGTPAGAPGKEVIAPKEESVYDKIWNLAKIYKDDNNPFIEEFDLTGRFQLDFFNVDSNKGSNDFWEIRRFRMGVDSWWANRHVELKATLDTNLRSFGADSVFYNRFTDLFARFVINDGFNVRVGKFEPHFGYDREFTDNNHKFFERTSFDEHLIGGNDYISGVEVSGKSGNFGYLAAVYSTNVDKEFGNFKGGQAYHAEINYDFSKDWGADKALWVLDYMHMDGKAKATNVFTNYRNAAATYLDYQKGRFCFVTQLGYADAVDSKGDLYQIMLMPSYYVIPEKLEVLLRYQYMHSDQANGISTKNRQEKTVGTFTGDNLNGVYVGVNYYLYGQKLKFMLGEQYTNLGGGTGPKAGFQGWTTLAGFRIYF